MILEDFSAEIMFEIIKMLTCQERRSLKLCSKKLFTLATEAPVSFSVVKFNEETHYLESENPEMVYVRLHLDGSDIRFVEREIHENVEKRYLRNIVIRSNVICDRFETNYQYTDNFLEKSEKVNARNLFVYKPYRPEEVEDSEPSKTVSMWLKHMNPRFLRSLTVYMDDKNITMTGTENELSCLDTLHVLRKSDIDDNILMKLKALDIEIQPAKITVRGINHLVRKWLTAAVPIGSRFVYYVNDPTGFAMTDIVKNINRVMSDEHNKVIIPILSDRFLKIWVDDSSVNVECFKKKKKKK